VGPRAGLGDVEKRKFLTLPGLELLSLVHSARSQSLYRLRYAGSWLCSIIEMLFLRGRLNNRSRNELQQRYPRLTHAVKITETQMVLGRKYGYSLRTER
jgi:hypothetical protein